MIELPLLDFGAALLIGTLLGIERERRKEGTHPTDIAGLRTFILLALAGGVAAWLSMQVSVWIFPAIGLVVGGLIISGYVSYTRRNASYGLTTEVAAVLVYLLGGCAVFGFRELALGAAVVASAVLTYKHPLHRMVAKMRDEDIRAGVKLLIASFIVLPLLPNEPIDPWEALNPTRMWWLVILISGLSLVGYIATRWLGNQYGNALTGFFGGLVSSTAVTLAFARRSAETGNGATLTKSLAAGVLLAWTIMFIRVLVEVLVVHPPLLPAVAWPMGVMGITTAVAAGLFWYRGRQAGPTEETDVPLKNPFSLAAAIKFAAFFSAVQVVVKLVQIYLPQQGMYAVAALAGLTDVDAITLSMAQNVAEGGSQAVAVTAITIATVTNTLVKCGFIVVLGARAMTWRIGAATISIVVAGLVTLLVT